MHLEKIEINDLAAATIVAVSGGYPLEFEKGFPIDFGYLSNPNAPNQINENGGVMVFHAATKTENGETVTNGGRVLAVSALADSLPKAVELSKEILEQIHFENIYYRGDIGYEFIS